VFNLSYRHASPSARNSVPKNAAIPDRVSFLEIASA
jgi:hypothetical protein